jgi:hypothetical protein
MRTNCMLRAWFSFDSSSTERILDGVQELVRLVMGKPVEQRPEPAGLLLLDLERLTPLLA